MKSWRHILALVLALQCVLLSGARGDDRPLSPEEIRALVARAVANQHRNDAMLEQYERIERRQIRRDHNDPRPITDKTFRVVPTGTGVVRVQTEENGRPVDAELYRKQLRDVEQALVFALRPDESRQKRAVEKNAKRVREHTEFLDVVPRAFLFTWLGRENHHGRARVKLALEPNPEFHPASRNQALLASVRATVWLDEEAAQVVRVEAEMTRDFSFGGGLVGKVYRGGRFVMEQAEAAPGIWLPTHYEYNFDGRKFLFSFGVHQRIEVSHYHRIGPPGEALAAIRRELGGAAAASTP